MQPNSQKKITAADLRQRLIIPNERLEAINAVLCESRPARDQRFPRRGRKIRDTGGDQPASDGSWAIGKSTQES